jgi:membrane protein DedA with SNARE-associated domain
VGQIIDAILGLGGAGAYVVIGLLAFGEAAAFVRLLLPGEVAACSRRGVRSRCR